MPVFLIEAYSKPIWTRGLQWMHLCKSRIYFIRGENCREHIVHCWSDSSINTREAFIKPRNTLCREKVLIILDKSSSNIILVSPTSPFPIIDGSYPIRFPPLICSGMKVLSIPITLNIPVAFRPLSPPYIIHFKQRVNLCL